MGDVHDRWNPSTFHLILFAVGGGLVYLGEEWGISAATEIGIACLGVLLIAAGLDIIRKRVTILRQDGWGYVVDAYRGALGLLWGLILSCLGGLIIIVMALTWLVPGGVGSFWSDTLLSSAGIGAMLSIGGLMLMLRGLIRALAGSGTVNPGQVGGLAGVLDRLAGVLVWAVGAALSAVGVTLLAAPGWAQAEAERFLGLMW